MATVGFADLRRGAETCGIEKRVTFWDVFTYKITTIIDIYIYNYLTSPLKPRFIEHLNRKFSRRKSNLTALLRYPTVNFKNVPCSNDGYGQNMGCTSGVSLKDTGAQSKQGRDDASQWWVLWGYKHRIVMKKYEGTHQPTLCFICVLS